MDCIVETDETVCVGVAAAGVVVFVADFDVLYVPGEWVAVADAEGAVGCGV